MKAKALLNLLSIGAIAIVGWFYVSSQWQQSQARRPGYDDPSASSPVPGLLPKPQSDPATVINVHDGDTITVKQGWQKVRVRLCGIDAPELSQPLGVESRDYLRSLLASAGEQVILSISDTDRYGRKVAELYVPAHDPQQPEAETFVNGEQVQVGWRMFDSKYVERCANGGVITQVAAGAKQKRQGMWSDPKALKIFWEL